MKIARTIALLIFFLGISCPSYSQETGLELLTIGPGSKALGTNEASTANLLGASDIYSNPANLALEPHSSLNTDYTLWIADLSLAHAAVNFKNDNRGIAFGFISASTDNIALRGNQAGPSNGSFSISFLSISGSYAYQLGPIALGATMQYLREEYYVYSASGYAANFGASSQLFSNRLQLGASLLNLGNMGKLSNQSTPLPSRFKAGANLELITFTATQKSFPIILNLIGDLTVPTQPTNGSSQSGGREDSYGSIALQAKIAQTVTLQSGYRTGDTVRPWSAGIGFDVGSVSAHYTFVPFQTGFGTVHSIGLSYGF